MAHAGTAGSAVRPGLERPASNRLAIWALGAGLLAGAAAWLVGEATLEVFRPTMVTMDTPVGRMTAASAAEMMRTDIKNAAGHGVRRAAEPASAWQLGSWREVWREARRGPGPRPGSPGQCLAARLAPPGDVGGGSCNRCITGTCKLDQVEQGADRADAGSRRNLGGGRPGGGVCVRPWAGTRAVRHRPGRRRWPGRSPARRVRFRGDGGDGVPQGRDDPAPLIDPRVAADGQDEWPRCPSAAGVAALLAGRTSSGPAAGPEPTRPEPPAGAPAA